MYEYLLSYPGNLYWAIDWNNLSSGFSLTIYFQILSKIILNTLDLSFSAFALSLEITDESWRQKTHELKDTKVHPSNKTNMYFCKRKLHLQV